MKQNTFFVWQGIFHFSLSLLEVGFVKVFYVVDGLLLVYHCVCNGKKLNAKKAENKAKIITGVG